MQIVISSEGFLDCVEFVAWHVAVIGDHQCGTPRRDHHAAAAGRGHHAAAESAIAAAMPGGANVRKGLAQKQLKSMQTRNIFKDHQKPFNIRSPMN